MHTILASNTSSISITKLGSATSKPHRVVSRHTQQARGSSLGWTRSSRLGGALWDVSISDQRVCLASAQHYPCGSQARGCRVHGVPPTLPS